MPDFPFTNQQTVHITHPFGTDHIPVYVEAEGFDRLVEVQYGNAYLDVVFGRVMAYGLVSYGGVGGTGLVLQSTPGSAGTVAKSGRKTSPVSSSGGNSSSGTMPQKPAASGSGRLAAGSAGILG